VAPGQRLDRDEALAFERHNRAALDVELRDFAPEVVCFWRLAELSLSLVERVAEAEVPALGYVGDGWLHEGPARDPWTPYRRRPAALGGAATWVFNSRWLRDSTRAHGVALEASHVVSPGVDRRRFTPRPLREWRGRLLCAGRLTPAKGVDVALRALARVPDAELLVAGDGSPDHVAELDGLAAALGVADRVTRRPAVSPRELAGLYREADAVLFPVRWQEPFGLVPLEAMASGTPVVATGTGGSAEYLLDGINALLVTPGDDAALAGAVTRLAGEPALRTRLREGGLGTAAAHDRDRSSARLEALLREAARSASRREEAAG
jgi:glycosyltransferase involved in cell wall biosynthesis